MRTGLVVLILALIALAFFNPSMDDFRLFARQQSEQLIRSQAGDGVLGEAIGTIGGRLAGDNIDRITERQDRKSTRLNSSHVAISYAVFCLKKKTTTGRTHL